MSAARGDPPKNHPPTPPPPPPPPNPPRHPPPWGWGNRVQNKSRPRSCRRTVLAAASPGLQRKGRTH